MQIRLWGTPEENSEMMDLLKNNLGDKIKIISSSYPSANGVTQRIYMEIALNDKNFRKYPIDYIPTRKELLLKQ